MNLPIRPKLKYLQVGDKFHSANAKGSAVVIFQVKGKCEFNSGHGSSTRMCMNMATKEIVSKSCRMEVVKLYYCAECGSRVAQGESYCKECVIV